jgi:hypothetical protein
MAAQVAALPWIIIELVIFTLIHILQQPTPTLNLFILVPAFE